MEDGTWKLFFHQKWRETRGKEERKDMKDRVGERKIERGERGLKDQHVTCIHCQNKGFQSGSNAVIVVRTLKKNPSVLVLGRTKRSLECWCGVGLASYPPIPVSYPPSLLDS